MLLRPRRLCVRLRRRLASKKIVEVPDARQARTVSDTLCDMSRPVTHYARSGDVSIAFQIVDSDGPLDVVFVHGFVGNMEVQAEQPGHEAFFERLASVGRVIRFDRRGTGLSDRVREVPTLEARMDDVRAVMDAVSSRRAALVASFEAASMTMVYAATYPERSPRSPFTTQSRRASARPTIPGAFIRRRNTST